MWFDLFNGTTINAERNWVVSFQIICEFQKKKYESYRIKTEYRRTKWVDPGADLKVMQLHSMSSIVLLPHEFSSLKYEGILKLNNQSNIGHLKTALAHQLNHRLPNKDQVLAR